MFKPELHRALLIGIDHYQTGFPALQGSVADVDVVDGRLQRL